MSQTSAAGRAWERFMDVGEDGEVQIGFDFGEDTEAFF